MTSKEIEAFAKGIAEYKGVISERDRLRFARIVRDVGQFSTAWPGNFSFERLCDINHEEARNASK